MAHPQTSSITAQARARGPHGDDMASTPWCRESKHLRPRHIHSSALAMSPTAHSRLSCTPRMVALVAQTNSTTSELSREVDVALVALHLLKLRAIIAHAEPSGHSGHTFTAHPTKVVKRCVASAGNPPLRRDGGNAWRALRLQLPSALPPAPCECTQVKPSSNLPLLRTACAFRSQSFHNSAY